MHFRKPVIYLFFPPRLPLLLSATNSRKSVSHKRFTYTSLRHVSGNTDFPITTNSRKMNEKHQRSQVTAVLHLLINLPITTIIFILYTRQWLSWYTGTTCALLAGRSPSGWVRILAMVRGVGAPLRDLL